MRLSHFASCTLQNTKSVLLQEVGTPSASCGVHIQHQGANMNWSQIEGKWHEMKGQAKSKWGKLTDDDLKTVGGKREQLIGKVQQRYGVMKEAAEKQVDDWTMSLVPAPPPKNAAPTAAKRA